LDEEEDKMFDECNAFVTTKCGRVSQQQIHARGRARAAKLHGEASEHSQ
jgi:hypothetical protein